MIIASPWRISRSIMAVAIGHRILMGGGFDRGETFDVTCTGRNADESIVDVGSSHFDLPAGGRCVMRSATFPVASFFRQLLNVAGETLSHSPNGTHSQLRLCVPFKSMLPFPISDTTHRERHDSPSTTGRLKKLKPIKCGGPGYNGCDVRFRAREGGNPPAA
jgi:hypothetical protein